jgi:hypothetical protein
MIIVAGGDSFIFGTELRDQVNGVHSKNTFPALLAKSKGMHYQCVATPGAANSEIARCVLNYCETHQDIDKFVIVQWTFPDRYEFRFPNAWRSVNVWNLQSEDEIKEHLKTFSQKTIDDQVNTNDSFKRVGYYNFVKEFFKHLGHTEFWETYTSMKEIVLLQNYLKLKNIPYMFSVADNCLLNNFTIDSKDVSLHSLYGQIDHDNFFKFPKEKGFYQWAMENKYPVGATHPLEEAHIDAAKLIKDKFNELVEKFI